jgi:hypothetical protein
MFLNARNKRTRVLHGAWAARTGHARGRNTGRARSVWARTRRPCGRSGARCRRARGGVGVRRSRGRSAGAVAQVGSRLPGLAVASGTREGAAFREREREQGGEREKRDKGGR